MFLPLSRNSYVRTHVNFIKRVNKIEVMYGHVHS